MGFVGFKTNTKEDKDLEELELLLRRMDPYQRIGSRSAAVKEAVRIALFHIKNSYFYKKGLTLPDKAKSSRKDRRSITVIPKPEERQGMSAVATRTPLYK